ncbi:hypothetical protein [Pedobacter sp. FW305-3-2-15-E-R2A2]|uniref:hypothetical protein n=1 Tax=Pedobacter sp. FW305-3-2-15-E-R2A2 TaxID=3140251 RepID=UPI00314089B8
MEFSIQHYFEFLSLLICIFCSGKLRHSFLIAFLPYLLIILCVELIAKYLYSLHHYNTSWIYNLMNLFSNGFYAFIFYRFATEKQHQLVLFLITSIYVSFSLLFHVLTSFKDFNIYIVAIGGIIQVFFSCLHFYYYLQNDEYVSERHYSSGLFIAAGVLIFYSGIAICFSLYHYIRFNALSLFGIPLYNLVPRYLSILLYLLISIALIIWKRPTKTSS